MELAARVDAAAATGDTALLEREIRALSDQAARVVPAFRKQSAVGIGIGLAKALALALLIRTLFIEPFRIPSGSMLPTLQVGDQIFVNKFIYGVRIPYANVVPFPIVRRPERGDVIVFDNPVTGQDYIKRVVGIPGDVLRFRDGAVYLNGHVVPGRMEQPQVDIWESNDGSPWRLVRLDLWTERLGTREHEILHTRPPRIDAPEGDIVVPAGLGVRDGGQPRQQRRQPLRPGRWGQRPQGGLRPLRPHQGQGDDHLALALPRRVALRTSSAAPASGRSASSARSAERGDGPRGPSEPPGSALRATGIDEVGQAAYPTGSCDGPAAR